VWLCRAIGHGRGMSYIRGLAGVFPLLPDMWKSRRALRRRWKSTASNLWQAILDSESLARHDFQKTLAGESKFLSWYFKRL
jgi:hypothetical protein